MREKWKKTIQLTLLLVGLVSCGQKKKTEDIPVSPVETAKIKNSNVIESTTKEELKLRVFFDAIGYGLVQPEDVPEVLAAWGVQNPKKRTKILGIALFMTVEDKIDAAFWDDRNNVWESRPKCIEDQGRCWYVREDFTPSGNLEEKNLPGSGSRLIVLLHHSRMASFFEKHPKLASLGIGELRLQVANGRIELEAKAHKDAQFRNAIDAAHYWRMLAINERAHFLQSSKAAPKFFEALPKSTLEVKKNTILFSMEGDCAMVVWSLRAIHQLYPFLRL